LSQGLPNFLVSGFSFFSLDLLVSKLPECPCLRASRISLSRDFHFSLWFCSIQSFLTVLVSGPPECPCLGIFVFLFEFWSQSFPNFFVSVVWFLALIVFVSELLDFLLSENQDCFHCNSDSSGMFSWPSQGRFRENSSL
jgi:hypothetical protein